MSGGRYEYVYQRIDALAGEIRLVGGCHAAPPHVREALKSHLLELALALKAVEWNDSGDGDEGEEKLLRELLSPGAPLEAARQQAEEAAERLNAEIERSRK